MAPTQDDLSRGKRGTGHQSAHVVLRSPDCLFRRRPAIPVRRILRAPQEVLDLIDHRIVNAPDCRSSALRGGGAQVERPPRLEGNAVAFQASLGGIPSCVEI